MGVMRSAPYVVADVILKSALQARAEDEVVEEMKAPPSFWQRLLRRNEEETE